MEVFFKTKKLRDICSDDKKLTAAFGKTNSKKIKLRINEFLSMDNLSMISMLPPPRLHALHGEREGEFAVDVQQPFRIVFQPYNLNEGDKNFEIGTVTQILILGVEDYHGK